MKINSLSKPTVPISYVILLLELAAERGVSSEAMLDGLGISEDLLAHPDARVGLLKEYGILCTRALRLTGEPALGYEFGLRASLTTHGLLGFGLMSQPTLGDVMDFAKRFGSTLRVPAWELRFLIEGDDIVVDAHEAVPHGPLRRFSCEQLLVTLASILRGLLPDPKFELRFDYPEPEYHARYREQLPLVRFSASVTQLRVSKAYLDMPLRTADVVSAKLADRECERELALIGNASDWIKQVRACLVNEDGGYYNLDIVAQRLHMTPRTLTRRLNELGSNFGQLRDEARHQDSIPLLQDPTLTLENIASRLGYSTTSNFARAFRLWTGESPGSFRLRLKEQTY